MVAGKRSAATDDDHFAITVRGVCGLVMRKCESAFTARAAHLALLYCSDPPSQRGGAKNMENTDVSPLIWYASIAEINLSSKTTPVGCTQDICLYNLTYFSSYLGPEYGCIVFPRNLGFRLSVCTESQHGRL
jgi:hypothetical protein